MSTALRNTQLANSGEINSIDYSPNLLVGFVPSTSGPLVYVQIVAAFLEYKNRTNIKSASYTKKNDVQATGGEYFRVKNTDYSKILNEFSDKLLRGMQEVPDEFNKYLEENMWDLLA